VRLWAALKSALTARHSVYAYLWSPRVIFVLFQLNLISLNGVHLILKFIFKYSSLNSLIDPVEDSFRIRRVNLLPN